ncbi:response regulator [Burkholderia sp. Ax-1719]|uniref:response regulator n=1 Tax=Burkholderia sp. Ax-1719 TaxID=2608334 RepID=UPI00142277AA|nr:response regulator [Burkholderia sp. Ax-1719]NIE68088.1 response regulator [Burkholderia sp. Ax-1719]
MTHGEDTGSRAGHADEAQQQAHEQAHEQAQDEAQHGDYRAALAGERVSIVLIEDDDGHATLVERNLRRSGVSNGFLRFRDGQEALDYFFGAPGTQNLAGYPSREDLANFVVLLDLRMPRVDGFEVLRRLKAEPVTASVPVIVLTTTDDPREIERCYELGCNVYITKPVEYDAFIEAVRRLGFFLQVVKLPAGHRFNRP